MNKQKAQERKLEPRLGLLEATAISIGAIIGGGIFVVTGIAAKLAGSAFLVSIVIAAIIISLTALSFSELATAMPVEGGIYEFAYRMISPFAGFLVGWMWLLSNIFAGAAVSLGFAYYLNAMFPGLPSTWVAALISILFMAVNLIGIRESALLNSILVSAKLIILTFFIALGLFFVNVGRFAPFNPASIGVFYGAAYFFFAYGGFARVTIVAEEIKDAKRIVPRAILLSIGISTVFYLLVGSVSVGLLGAARLGVTQSPLADAIATTEISAAVYAISVGGLLATASVLLTSILGVSRVAYAMGRRNDLPKAFSVLNSKFKTPYVSILVAAAVMIVLVLSVDFSGVVAMSTFSLLFYYILANVSAFRLKKEDTLYPRVVPVLGVATCSMLLILIVFISPQAWIVGISALVIGAIYYFFKRKYSDEKTLKRRKHA